MRRCADRSAGDLKQCMPVGIFGLSLIRSTLDYGCTVYGSAAKSVLTELDRVQMRALRICLGAIRTSPVRALQVEAG